MTWVLSAGVRVVKGSCGSRALAVMVTGGVGEMVDMADARGQGDEFVDDGSQNTITEVSSDALVLGQDPGVE